MAQRPETEDLSYSRQRTDRVKTIVWFDCFKWVNQITKFNVNTSVCWEPHELIFWRGGLKLSLHMFVLLREGGDPSVCVATSAFNGHLGGATLPVPFSLGVQVQ